MLKAIALATPISLAMWVLLAYGLMHLTKLV
jgi:hypothetical protein